MSDATPRLRFAPSPTGMFHVGGARTALYNWLFVRRTGGTFILRIEDTDAERDRQEWVEGILDAMRWLGLDWDEGPYRQSSNIALHEAAGKQLYDGGNAYYCECRRDDVEARAKKGTPPGYDRFCRDRNLDAGPGRALRFRVPDGKTIVTDLVRGHPEFDNNNIEDFVVVRSTGVPVYLLANVVDDIDQRVTHVVRAEEHLSNAPKQQMLWQALGGPALPIYAHLPVVVNEKRQKLSKRRDKVALEMYRDEGFLPEAMLNYLALLGWAPRGDREIVSIDEMVGEFRFEDVNKSGAFFDLVKLTHVNGEYIRMLELDDFVSRCKPFLDRASGEMWKPEDYDPSRFLAVAQLTQERVARLDEVPAMVRFLFTDDVQFDPAAMKAMTNPAARPIVEAAVHEYATCEWKTSSLHEATLAIGEANGLKLGKAQAPIRLAVTGNKVGLPLFESLEVLGRERTIARLNRLLEVTPEGL